MPARKSTTWGASHRGNYWAVPQSRLSVQRLSFRQSKTIIGFSILTLSAIFRSQADVPLRDASGTVQHHTLLQRGKNHDLCLVMNEPTIWFYFGTLLFAPFIYDFQKATNGHKAALKTWLGQYVKITSQCHGDKWKTSIGWLPLLNHFSISSSEQY